MKFFHFTEMPYPHISPEVEEATRGLKTFMPNRYYDPVRGYDLYQRYLDEYELADELGYHLMVNEHHQSAATLHVSATLSAAAVASRTRKGRILVLGTPLPHRTNPVRVAEEIAFLDAMTGGRIECGFVRGTQAESYPSNENPVHNMEMFYESHDLIKEAWTNHDPFSWEGRFYHYRHVSVWPRPFQQPHPPIWVSGTTPGLVQWTARNGYTLCNLLGRYEDAASTFRMYRRTAIEAGRPEPSPSQFAYLALCHVAETEEEARRVGEELMYYLKPGRPRLGALIPPGFSTPATSVNALRGELGTVRKRSFEELVDEGIMLVGTPETVTKQIERLYERTGVGNVLLMNHAGAMSSNDVRKSMCLFTDEVRPAVEHLGENWAQDDTSWRVENDKESVGTVIASALS